MQSLFNLGFVIKLVDQMTAPLKAVEKSVKHLDEEAKAAQARMKSMHDVGSGMMKAGAGITAAGFGMGMALKSVIQPAMDIQAAMAHVNTAVDDGADTHAHLAEVEALANQLMSEGVIKNTQLAQSYYNARSGMLDHKQALDAMSASMRLVTGTTENAEAAQAAMGQTTRTLGALVLNLGGNATGWADKLAALQTKFAFKDITEISTALEYAAPVMKGLKTNANDAMAVLAGLSAAGLHGEKAGTSFRAFVEKLAVGKELYPYAKKTKEGGLDLIGSLEAISKRVQSMSGVQRTRFIEQLGFGLEEGAGVNLLASNEIIKKMKETAAAIDEVGAAEKAAKTRMASLDMSMVKLGSNWTLLKGAFGKQMFPALDSIVEGLTKALQWAKGVVETYPTVSKWIGLTALGFAALALTVGPVVVGLGTMAWSLSNLGVTAAVLKVPLGGIARGIGWLLTPLRSFGGLMRFVMGAGDLLIGTLGGLWTALQAGWVFFTTNPLGWIILGIAALAALGYAIYKYRDQIKAFAAEVMVVFSNLPGWMYEAGANLLKSLGDGIKSGAKGVLDGVSNIAGKIKDHFVGHSPPPLGPLADIGRANLMETLAGTINPGPMLSAIRRAAAATAMALPLTMAPAFGATAAPTGSGTVTLNLNYAPTINPAPGDERDFRQLLDDHSRDLVRILDRELQRLEGLKY